MKSKPKSEPPKTLCHPNNKKGSIKHINVWRGKPSNHCLPSTLVTLLMADNLDLNHV